MNRHFCILQLIAVFVIANSAVLADVIVLKSGQRIEGDVLKVQKDTVFVDVGVDVIRIPVDQILERISLEPVKEDAAKTEAGVFMSSDLPERTVKELVSGAVLVEHHPRQGFAWPLLPVGPSSGSPGHVSRGL